MIAFVSAISLIAGTTRKLLRISMTFCKESSFKEPITFFKGSNKITFFNLWQKPFQKINIF